MHASGRVQVQNTILLFAREGGRPLLLLYGEVAWCLHINNHCTDTSTDIPVPSHTVTLGKLKQRTM